MMMNPIMSVEYDPKWPELFESLRERIAGKLGSIAAAIEYIGAIHNI